MSILDKIKGEGEGEGGAFNPFRILDIGEIMVRYCDGIKIKDYVFFGILTSERFMLIDSVHQSAGVIAKEIPISVIKDAELERDEKDRPTLAVNMEIGGQSRVMRLVFTGLVDEPETECREWFTAINGYPPERLEQLEPAKPEEPAQQPAVSPILDEPAPREILEEIRAPKPIITEVKPEVKPEPVKKPEPEVIPEPEIQEPVIRHEPPVVIAKPRRQKSAASVPHRRSESVHPDITTPPDGSIRITLEKPDITPIKIQREISTLPSDRTGSSKFCIHCGSHIPPNAKFCPACGKQQI